RRAAPQRAEVMKVRAAVVPLALLLSVAAPRSTGHAQQAAAPSFDSDVRPILDEVCTRCHNEKKANAGLNFGPFMDPASLSDKRDTWELMVDKVKSGDMPPADEDQLSVHERAAMVSFLAAAFAQADRGLKPA